jgi:hypothetical protein
MSTLQDLVLLDYANLLNVADVNNSIMRRYVITRYLREQLYAGSKFETTAKAWNDVFSSLNMEDDTVDTYNTAMRGRCLFPMVLECNANRVRFPGMAEIEVLVTNDSSQGNTSVQFAEWSVYKPGEIENAEIQLTKIARSCLIDDQAVSIQVAMHPVPLDVLVPDTDILHDDRKHPIQQVTFPNTYIDGESYQLAFCLSLKSAQSPEDLSLRPMIATGRIEFDKSSEMTVKPATGLNTKAEAIRLLLQKLRSDRGEWAVCVAPVNITLGEKNLTHVVLGSLEHGASMRDDLLTDGMDELYQELTIDSGDLESSTTAATELFFRSTEGEEPCYTVSCCYWGETTRDAAFALVKDQHYKPDEPGRRPIIAAYPFERPLNRDSRLSGLADRLASGVRRCINSKQSGAEPSLPMAEHILRKLLAGKNNSTAIYLYEQQDDAATGGKFHPFDSEADVIRRLTELLRECACSELHVMTNCESRARFWSQHLKPGAASVAELPAASSS